MAWVHWMESNNEKRCSIQKKTTFGTVEGCQWAGGPTATKVKNNRKSFPIGPSHNTRSKLLKHIVDDRDNEGETCASNCVIRENLKQPKYVEAYRGKFGQRLNELMQKKRYLDVAYDLTGWTDKEDQVCLSKTHPA
jgi:hypothetical protein